MEAIHIKTFIITTELDICRSKAFSVILVETVFSSLVDVLIVPDNVKGEPLNNSERQIFDVSLIEKTFFQIVATIINT